MLENINTEKVTGDVRLSRREEQEILRQLKEKNSDGDFLRAVVAEEKFDPVTKSNYTRLHFGNPFDDQPSIVTLRSRASVQEIEKLCGKIFVTPEASLILTTLAQCYQLNSPVLFEGPTATGRTYLIEKFTEMLYGRGKKPLDFYCSGQTDVSELMGKWVPAGENARDKELWNSYLESGAASSRLTQAAEASANAENLTPEQRKALTLAKLREIAAEAGLAGNTQWEFQYGAVPLAMRAAIGERGEVILNGDSPEGFILHVEEVGLAKPVVVNALLKLRGELGQTAREIQLWENGGEKIVAGEKFWFAMSTNPPEEYLDRNEIDPALARGMIFVRLPEVSDQSFKIAARHYLRYEVGNAPEQRSPNCILELQKERAICDELALIIGTFHKEFVQALRHGESGRQQRVPATFDDMARLGKYLLSVQVRSKTSGLLDLPETLRRGINLIYLNRLADTELKKTLNKALEQLLTGETGEKAFRGGLKTRQALLNQLVEDALSGASPEEAEALPAQASDAQEQIEDLQMQVEDITSDLMDELRRLGLETPQNEERI